MKVKSVYQIVAPFATDSDISREHIKNLIEYLQPGREMRIRGDTSMTAKNCSYEAGS